LGGFSVVITYDIEPPPPVLQKNSKCTKWAN
jgi:hypothetical protein